MSSFNDQLKKITLKEILILIIALFIVQSLINAFDIVHIDSAWLYVIVVFYFVFRLKDSLSSLKSDFKEVFFKDNLKVIVFVVILNIFISYGFLYLADYLLGVFPDLNLILSFHMSHSIAYASLFVTVVISPICEELIFRGVFYNRFKLIVPVLFAVLVSSLVFAALHSFGNILSAFIFALSMAVLYVKTDNILIPITAHFLNNLFAESFVILNVNEVLFGNVGVFYVMCLFAVFSFVLIFYWIVKQLNTISEYNI